MPTPVSIPNFYGGLSQKSERLRSSNQMNEVTNIDITVEDGISKRNPITYVSALDMDVSSTDAFVHTWTKDEDSTYFMKFNGSGVEVYDQTGVEKNVHFLDTSSYVSSLGDGKQPRDVFKTLSIGDATVVLRTDKETAMDSDLTAAADASSAYVFFKQAQLGYVTFRIGCQLDTSADVKRWTYSNSAKNSDSANNGYRNGSGWYTRHTADTKAVASRHWLVIMKPSEPYVQGIWGDGAVSATLMGSVLKLYKANGKPFADISTADGLGDQAMSLIWQNVDSLDGLPVNLDTPGYKVRVLGNKSDKSDDFYVEWAETGKGVTYETSGEGDLSAVDNSYTNVGYWKESNGFLKEYKYDYTTMPHAVIRRPDNNFLYMKLDGAESWNYDMDSVNTGASSITFGENHNWVAGETVIYNNDTVSGLNIGGLVDGLTYFIKSVPDASTITLSRTLDGTIVDLTTTGTDSPHNFKNTTYENFKFGERDAGDNISNPLPSFIGKPINSMALYRNRLCFIATDSVNCSEFGEFFNFFRVTVQELIETAPIEVAATDNKTREFVNAVGFKDKLVVFSKDGQFVLQGSPGFSPETVSFTLATAYQSNTKADPFILGDKLFFFEKRGNYNRVQELKEVQYQGNYEAYDVSIDVPKLLAGNIQKVVSNGIDKIALFTDDDLSKVHILTIVDNAQGERIVQGWYTHKFDDIELETIAVVENTLYAVGLFEGKHRTLFEMATLNNFDDIFLDNRVISTKTLSKSYDPPSDTTTYTMPFTFSGTDWKAVNTDTLYEYTISGTTSNTIVLQTDTTADTIYFGMPYESKIQFSKFYPQAKQGTGTVISDQLVLDSFNVSFDQVNRQAFDVSAAIDNGKTYVKEYTSNVTDTQTLGAAYNDTDYAEVLVQSRNKDCRLTISNNTYVPFNLINFEYYLSEGSKRR